MARGNSTKSRIHDVALQLFNDSGYGATSVRDIMRACNLTAGALYSHYESKEQVLFGLIMEGHLRLNEVLGKVEDARGDEDPALLLSELIYQLVVHHLTHTALARVAIANLDALPEGMATEVNQLREKINGYFERAYQRGISAGQFETRHHRFTLLAMFASANGFTEWFDSSGPVSREELARWHATMILRIVMFPKASAAAIEDLVDRAARAAVTLA